MAEGRRSKSKRILLVLGAAIGVALQTAITTQVLLAVVPPTVVFHPAVVGDSAVTIDVKTAYPPRPLRDFRAEARNNNGTFATMEPLASSVSTGFTFSDRDADGVLSAGDRFGYDGFYPGYIEVVLFVRGNEVLSLYRWTEVGRGAWSISLPEVQLGTPSVGYDESRFEVLTANPSLSIAQYGVVYVDNGGTLEAVAPLRVGRTGYLQFEDTDGDGNLSAGDRFTGDLVYGGRYEANLYWHDQRVANVSWDRAPPSVALAVDQIAWETFWFNVTSSDPAMPLGDFVASILCNGLWQDQVDSLPAGSSRYGHMQFLDVDGGGNLTVSDRFVVTEPFSGQWELYLFWRMSEAAHVFF